jgi:PIN domain nuclease of toxin-antitoxin system
MWARAEGVEPPAPGLETLLSAVDDQEPTLFLIDAASWETVETVRLEGVPEPAQTTRATGRRQRPQSVQPRLVGTTHAAQRRK